MARRWATLAVLLAALALTASACCPVTAPPSTAFVAQLTPIADGSALAQLSDGRQLVVTGLARVPAGMVYVRGRLQPDGTVTADSVQPTATSFSSAP